MFLKLLNRCYQFPTAQFLGKMFSQIRHPQFDIFEKSWKGGEAGDGVSGAQDFILKIG